VCSTNDVITAETKAGWLTRADSSNFGDRGAGVKGIEIRGTGTNDFNSLSAVQSVSVARGATLKAVGEIELSSLTVDCASGGGTIDGFSLASGGELRAVNVPKTGCDLPVQFSNVQGLANLKAWNVSVDGKSGRMTLAVGADGKVRLVQKGFMVICR
jgi:hypothetical protein